MKTTSLAAAASIIVVANALALMHAFRNRTGSLEAEITLSNHEARYSHRALADEDSGVELDLESRQPHEFPWPASVENPPRWLGRQMLQGLGFDCNLNPDSPGAGRFYQRQKPRQAFVALEYDGPAWRAWLETYQRSVAEQRARNHLGDSADYSQNISHLVAMDADLNAAKLRARYPDRRTVVILPAVIEITLEPFPSDGMKADPGHPVQIVGYVREIPSAIHVPRPFSDQFRSLDKHTTEVPGKEPSYRVHLRYGASLEPWVTGVEFVNER